MTRRELVVVGVGLTAMLAVGAAVAVFTFWSTVGTAVSAVAGEVAGPTAETEPATSTALPTPSVTLEEPPDAAVKITASATTIVTEAVSSPSPLPLATLPEPTTTTHTVQPGENLFRISLRYGVTVAQIMAANNISNPDFVGVGQILVIPHNGSTVEQDSEDVVPLTTPGIDATIQGDLAAGAPDSSVTGTPSPEPLAATATVPPTDTPAASPAPPPPPAAVNGIALESIIVMPQDVIEHSRQIFAFGQALGNNVHAFSKVGDSTIENPHFLARFDSGPYNLGDYAYLQPVIDYFAGSYGRQGNAVRRGFHSWTVTDPLWADKDVCQPNESPVACEIRVHRPSVLLIRLGSNDAGVPGSFDVNVRQLVQYAIDNGVIPVLGTKADRFEGPGNINNDILRQIAVDFKIPLWDFDLVAGTLPGRGIYPNDIHLTIFFAHDYTLPQALQTGHGVHNLTALMMLDALLREVIEPASQEQG